MNYDKDEEKESSQTCHLCGKVQCGQRLGRVKCCLCNRIFCLQQLSRKFHIIATANDPYFKCPRCTGICCCVCNCQKPPPHVHCKVYKVRQNKMKQAANAETHFDQENAPIKLPIQEISSIQSVEDPTYGNRAYAVDAPVSVSPVRWEGMSGNWQDPQSLWQLPSLEVPGSRFRDSNSHLVQNGDGLTQLNLRLLDNWDQNYYNTPNQSKCVYL